MSSVFLLELIIKEAIFHASNSYYGSYKSTALHIWASGQGVIADVFYELKGSWMDAKSSTQDITPTLAEVLKSEYKEKQLCALFKRSWMPENLNTTLHSCLKVILKEHTSSDHFFLRICQDHLPFYSKENDSSRDARAKKEIMTGGGGDLLFVELQGDDQQNKNEESAACQGLPERGSGLLELLKFEGCCQSL